jgi:kynurenine aminotransferase
LGSWILQYDVLALKPSKHVRIASLDHFWNRTITVGSAGKNFSCTGWRVGWLIGPANLIRACLAASTRVTFCTNSPLQEAAAAGFEQADEQRFFESEQHGFTNTRERMILAQLLNTDVLFFLAQREWYEKLRDTLLTALDKLGLP